jgi:hypothetical protein
MPDRYKIHAELQNPFIFYTDYWNNFYVPLYFQYELHTKGIRGKIFLARTFGQY